MVGISCVKYSFSLNWKPLVGAEKDPNAGRCETGMGIVSFLVYCSNPGFVG